MKISNPKKISEKDLIVFDLDGTIAPSKSITDREMINLLLRLLEKKRVAVIGGGKYSLFREQLTDRFPPRDKRLVNLSLFPTTSNAFYRYYHGWKNIYNLILPRSDKIRIRKALRQVLSDIGYVPPKKIYGVTLEDRQTQMSFSPLGQDVVTVLGKKGIRKKEEWKKKNDRLRFRIAKLLQRKLPHLEVHVGGITTIDITRKGIDKSYGVKQIAKHLRVPISKMLFVGDAIYPGGNDYEALKTGVDYVKVKDPADTKKLIQKLLRK